MVLHPRALGIPPTPFAASLWVSVAISLMLSALLVWISPAPFTQKIGGLQAPSIDADSVLFPVILGVFCAAIATRRGGFMAASAYSFALGFLSLTIGSYGALGSTTTAQRFAFIANDSAFPTLVGLLSVFPPRLRFAGVAFGTLPTSCLPTRGGRAPQFGQRPLEMRFS